jgi:biopolymer transport protein ExbD
MPAVMIINLVDILAILVIFLVVSTTFKRDQPEIVINLPESKTAEPAPANQSEPLLLRISSENKISIEGGEMLDGGAVTVAELSEKFKKLKATGRPLALEADKTAHFQVIVKVWDALKLAGITNVPTFTNPGGEK